MEGTPDVTSATSVVRSSPQLVGTHQKERWIALFADDCVIEDPVGSRPVRSEGISDFWDCFIAPNDIRFEVHSDWFSSEPGGSHVVRDVTIHTTLRTGVVVQTPAHLRYELDDRLEVTRMAAHWEPAPVFAQLIRPRGTHVRSMLTMSARMLRHLGVGGTVRFAGAVRSVGRAGKRAVVEHLGDSVQDLRKVIAAGNTVTASCTVDGLPAAVIAVVEGGVVVDCRVYRDAVAA